MQSLPDLSALSHEQKDELIWLQARRLQEFEVRFDSMQQRIEELEGRLSLNSRNSSKPPSTDGLTKPKPAPKSLRQAGQRPSGGQKGHEGNTLRQSAQVDEVIRHQGDARCSVCHGELLDHEVIGKRQVFELPELRARVIEHQVIRSRCTCGAVHEGVYPPDIHSPVQYGPGIKAVAVHLSQQHLVPLQRTCSLVDDLFGVSLSQASVIAFNKQAAQQLAATVEAIGQAVQGSPVVHADESGICVKGQLAWLHCAVTDALTWLGWHTRRGPVAFEELGILSGVQGTLVHDGLAGYKGFACAHSLCNAHHLRELLYVHEQGKDKEKIWDGWAREMMDLLVLANKEVHEVRQAGPVGATLPAWRQAWFEAQWEALLQRGETWNPQRVREGAPRGTQGRHAQSKAFNLLRRLRKHREDVWRFMTDEGVPFTNNLAEQALRMCKVRQKISGCFRTEEGASTFFTVRSYLATMRKQHARLLDCLISVFRGQPVQPAWSG